MPGLQGQVVRRVVRGLVVWRSRRHEMEALGSGEWLVPSTSSEDVRHRVSLVEDTCTCRSARYSLHRCKHRWAVEFELALRQVLADAYPEIRDVGDPYSPDGDQGSGRRPW